MHGLPQISILAIVFSLAQFNLLITQIHTIKTLALPLFKNANGPPIFVYIVLRGVAFFTFSILCSIETAFSYKKMACSFANKRHIYSRRKRTECFVTLHATFKRM